jgi:hypothetical protein
MKRALPLALLLIVVGFVTMSSVRRTATDSETLSPPADNPAHFTPGDVALLAATGRPQLVEVFHYG